MESNFDINMGSPKLPPRKLRTWTLRGSNPTTPTANTTSSGPSTMTRSSSTLPSQPIICQLCSQPFISQYNLNQHLQNAHPTSLKSNDKSSSFLSESDSDSDQSDFADTLTSWFRQAHSKVIVPLSKKTPNLQQLSKLAKGENPDLVFDDRLRREDSSSSINPELAVKKDHFKSLNGASTCFQRECYKTLGLLSGKVNCTRCGEVFCESHCDLLMKLSPSAIHDPVNGQWHKVCLSCYQTKPNYFNHDGPTRDVFSEYKVMRSKVVDKIQLETNRLEMRLHKLAQCQYEARVMNEKGKDGLRGLEQSVVAWQPDNEVKNCPHCSKGFNRVTLRRHHCRLCGKVVCFGKGCSNKLDLSTINIKSSVQLPPNPTILTCITCHNLVSTHLTPPSHLKSNPTLTRYYTKLKRLQTVILRHQPTFNTLIYTIQSNKTISSNDTNVQQALAIRKELLDAFSQYETLIQSMKSAQLDGTIQKKVMTSMILAAVTFLQENTVSLSTLPKLLNQSQNSNQPIPSQPIKFNPHAAQLYQQLDVFVQQRNNLNQFISDATTNRRLDDVKNLMDNLKEIEDEINRINLEINKLN